jgi:hypothetical protein
MLHIQICTELLPDGARYVAWFDHAIFEGEDIPEIAEKIALYMVMYQMATACAVAHSTHMTTALCDFENLPPPEVYEALEGKPCVLGPRDRKSMRRYLHTEAQKTMKV